MRQPPARIRARIWSRQLASRGIEASAEDAQALAYEFDATPGVAAGATAAADLGEGGFELVRRGVRSLSRVLGCERPAQREQRRVRPRIRRGGHRPRAAHRPTHRSWRPALLALSARTTGHWKERVRPSLGGPPRLGGPAKARLRPAVNVRGWHRGEHRRCVRRSARPRARSWSSTRPTPYSPTVAAHTASGRSAKSTRC